MLAKTNLKVCQFSSILLIATTISFNVAGMLVVVMYILQFIQLYHGLVPIVF